MTEQDERNIETVRLMYAGEATERTLILNDAGQAAAGSGTPHSPSLPAP